MGPHPHPSAVGRVARRVRQEVLEDPLDLWSVQVDDLRLDVHRHPMVPNKLGVLHDSPHQSTDVCGLPVRLGDPARQPVEIEQVGQETFELAGIRHQPGEQVLPILDGQGDLLPLQGQGDPQDGRQRCGGRARSRAYRTPA